MTLYKMNFKSMAKKKKKNFKSKKAINIYYIFGFSITLWIYKNTECHSLFASPVIDFFFILLHSSSSSSSLLSVISSATLTSNRKISFIINFSSFQLSVFIFLLTSAFALRSILVFLRIDRFSIPVSVPAMLSVSRWSSWGGDAWKW